MYAPVHLGQGLAELNELGTGWRESGGGWWVSIQILAEVQTPGGLRQEALGGRCMVAKIVMWVDITTLVYIIF
jgi:hypothetical protein